MGKKVGLGSNHMQVAEELTVFLGLSLQGEHNLTLTHFFSRGKVWGKEVGQTDRRTLEIIHIRVYIVSFTETILSSGHWWKESVTE
jgi:hypothetical protein